MDNIWVICISHSYGVWCRAGYFITPITARVWIKRELIIEKAKHDKMRTDWDEIIDGSWSEYKPTEFYIAELKLNKQ